MLVLLTAACHHRTNQYVHFDAHKNAVVLAPSLIRTGDPLYFVSYDTVLAAKYQVGSSKSDAVVGAVAPLYGALDISKLAAGIPETIRAVASGVAPSVPAVSQSVDSTMKEMMSFSAFSELKPAAKIAELSKLVAERNRLINLLCEGSIRTATTWVLHHPSRAAYLRGIFDTTVRQLTSEIIDTPLPGQLKLDATLARASASLVSGTLSLPQADSMRVAGTLWSRRLAALLIAFGGQEALSVGQSGELAMQLAALAVCRREDARASHTDLKQLNDTINKLWNDLKPPPTLEKWPSARTVRVAGFNFDVLIDDAPGGPDSLRRDSLEKHVKRLNDIAGLSIRLETALASIPEFTARKGRLPCDTCALEKALTMTADSQYAIPDTVYVGTYWSPTQLVLTPERGQRFPKVMFSSLRSEEPSGGGGGSGGGSAGGSGGGAGSGAAGRTPQTGGTGGGGGTPASAEKEKGQGATPSGGGEPAGGGSPQNTANQDSKSKEAPPPKSPYPAVTIDVLEPSRFQLGVGYGRTRLGGDELSQEKDTVDGVPGIRVTRIGERPYANLPLLMLSYYVLPMRGKVFAGQAYDGNFWTNAGLAFTLGLALDAPLDRVFFGLSTEPVPGVNVSLGVAAAYIEKADTLGFIPTAVNASPVRKAWRRGPSPLKNPAWAISIDPAIALNALGKLIGLK